MNKGKNKAKATIDFEILHIGICDAVICIRLPIEEAVAKLNRESPTGIGSKWRYDGGAGEHEPCPDGQGKTHYRLFC